MQSLIVEILNRNNLKRTLKALLSNPNLTWEELVYTSSSHLVLPAIYYRLKKHTLLEMLPEDLIVYLEEFCGINYNRNKQLLREAKAISVLLKKNHIDHVFIKGVAVLAYGVHDSIGARMVGDIDILLNKADIPKAIGLLKCFGYQKQKGFNYKNIGFRHEDRLIDESKLAAIEIHSSLFNAPNQNLVVPKQVIDNRMTSSVGLDLPSLSDMCLIQVLTFQINDYGHYYNFFSLKVFYDNHCLGLSENKKALNFLYNTKYGRSYLKLYFYHLGIRNEKKQSARLFWFKIKQKYLWLNHLITFIKKAYKDITSRIDKLCHNPYYRKHIYKILISKNKSMI